MKGNCCAYSRMKKALNWRFRAFDKKIRETQYSLQTGAPAQQKLINSTNQQFQKIPAPGGFILCVSLRKIIEIHFPPPAVFLCISLYRMILPYKGFLSIILQILEFQEILKLRNWSFLALFTIYPDREGINRESPY